MTLDDSLRQQITDEIISMIAQQASRQREEITLETKLVSDLEYDSLDRIELIMNLEDRYENNGVKFPESDVEKMGNDPRIGSIVDYVFNNYKL